MANKRKIDLPDIGVNYSERSDNRMFICVAEQEGVNDDGNQVLWQTIVAVSARDVAAAKLKVSAHFRNVDVPCAFELYDLLNPNDGRAQKRSMLGENFLQ